MEFGLEGDIRNGTGVAAPGSCGITWGLDVVEMLWNMFYNSCTILKCLYESENLLPQRNREVPWNCEERLWLLVIQQDDGGGAIVGVF